MTESDLLALNTPTHRYALKRVWDPGKPLVFFCGLNPSTATDSFDDPTIRREIGFAKSWGYGGFWKGNLYALRSTDPKGLKHLYVDPWGLNNDTALSTMATLCPLRVAAWGSTFQPRPRKGGFTAYWRAQDVIKALTAIGDLHCIGVPRVKPPERPPHPLYLSSLLRPVLWRPSTREESSCAR